MLGKKFIAYVIIAFIIGLRLSSKTDNRILSFTFVFWIIASPILWKDIFFLEISFLPINIQPNRLLLIFLILYLFFDRPTGNYTHQSNRNFQKPVFELFIYIYLITVLISFMVNYPQLQYKQQVITVPLEILLFILIYHIAKTRVSFSVLDSIIKALVIVSLSTSIIAIYQYLFEPYFFRSGGQRGAFGSLFRSTGIFHDEYELSCLLIISIIVFFVRYKGSKFLYISLPLLIIALITTFHRLSWIIFAVSFVSYFFITRKIKLVIIIPFLLLLMAVYAFSPYLIGYLEGGKSFRSFKEERLLSDTVTSRFLQYEIATKIIADNFWGIGGYDNKIYYDIMEEYSMTRSETKPGSMHSNVYVIHNGYLSTGVLYGIPSMVAFIGMILSMLVYFAKQVNIKNEMTIIPVYIIFIWLMFNISNNFSNFNFYYILLVALLSGSFVSLYNRNIPHL